MVAIRQVVYVSASVRLMRDVELLAILETARTKNLAEGLTGMLLYAEGSFIQVLEGESTKLERTLRVIRRDARHHRVLLLLDRVVQERDFDGWTMAFQRVTLQELDEIAGFHDWDSEMPTKRKSAVAARLIESFRRTATTH